MIEISYVLLEKEIYDLLGENKILVLATSSDNRVTARSVSCIVTGKKVCFQTDKAFLKYKQIIKNQNVALCTENIQIEGIAKIKGHPLTEENKDFAEKYKKYYKSSYDNYSHLENEAVIEVEPTYITLWKYENGQPYRDFLDVKAEKAYRQYYDTRFQKYIGILKNEKSSDKIVNELRGE
jgi:uncharacterized pyridoxamine 5'-phosphate oxidase family protein